MVEQASYLDQLDELFPWVEEAEEEEAAAAPEKKGRKGSGSKGGEAGGKGDAVTVSGGDGEKSLVNESPIEWYVCVCSYVS